MRRLFLFLKAYQPGLFDEQVTVSGHATKTGKYVQAYQAKRKKRLKDVVDGDMFDEAPQWGRASPQTDESRKPEKTTKKDIELAKKKAEIESRKPKKSPAESLDHHFETTNEPGKPAFVILSKDGRALDWALGHNLQKYAEFLRDTRSNQEVYETATVRRFSKKEWEQFRVLQNKGNPANLAGPQQKEPEAKKPGDLFAEAAAPKPKKEPTPEQAKRQAEKAPAPRDYGTPIANRIGAALKSGDLKTAIDAITPLSPQETAEALLRVGFTMGTYKKKAEIMAFAQKELLAAAKARKDGYEMRPLKKSATITERDAELIGEHRRLVRVLRSPSHEDDLKEADEQEAELREYEKKAKRKKKVCKAFLVAPLHQLLKARAHA